MRVVYGWRLYEYAAFKAQKAKLEAAVEVRKRQDPDGWQGSADAKLLRAIQHLTDEVIPANPNARSFRHGGTLAGGGKHWFRAKFGNGRRLFFQFNSSAKMIIYAWVNDDRTLRTYGSRTDAYKVFAAMVAKGHPPDNWDALAKAVGAVVGRKSKAKKPSRE